MLKKESIISNNKDNKKDKNKESKLTQPIINNDSDIDIQISKL